MNYEVLNKKYSSEQTNITCVICLEDVIISKTKVKPEILKEIEETNLCNCLEKIHEECLESWLKVNMSCPLCRKEFDNKKELIRNGFASIESPIWETYYIEEDQQRIQYYEDRRQRLKIVNYLLRLACIIIITTLIFSGYNIIQKISSLF